MVEIKDNTIVIKGKTCDKTTKFVDQELIDFQPTEKVKGSKSKTYKIQWTTTNNETDYVVLQFTKYVTNAFESKTYDCKTVQVKNKDGSIDENKSRPKYESLKKAAKNFANSKGVELITASQNPPVYLVKWLRSTSPTYSYSYTNNNITNLNNAQDKIKLFAKSYDNGDFQIENSILKAISSLLDPQTTKPAEKPNGKMPKI